MILITQTGIYRYKASLGGGGKIFDFDGGGYPLSLLRGQLPKGSLYSFKFWFIKHYYILNITHKKAVDNALTEISNDLFNKKQ